MSKISKKNWKWIAFGAGTAVVLSATVALSALVPQIVNSKNQTKKGIETKKEVKDAPELRVEFVPSKKDDLQKNWAGAIEIEDVQLVGNHEQGFTYSIIKVSPKEIKKKVFSGTEVEIKIQIEKGGVLKTYSQFIKNLSTKKQAKEFITISELDNSLKKRNYEENDLFFKESELKTLWEKTPEEILADFNNSKQLPSPDLFKDFKIGDVYGNDFNQEFIGYKKSNKPGKLWMEFKVLSKQSPNKIFKNFKIISPLFKNPEIRKVLQNRIDKAIKSPGAFKPKFKDNRSIGDKITIAYKFNDFAGNPAEGVSVDGVRIRFANQPEKKWAEHLKKTKNLNDGIIVIVLEAFIENDKYSESNPHFYSFKFDEKALTLNNLMNAEISDREDVVSIPKSSLEKLKDILPIGSEDGSTEEEKIDFKNQLKIDFKDIRPVISSRIKNMVPEGFLTFDFDFDSFGGVNYTTGSVDFKAKVKLNKDIVPDYDNNYGFKNIRTAKVNITGFKKFVDFGHEYLQLNQKAYNIILFNNKELNSEDFKSKLNGDDSTNKYLDKKMYSLTRATNDGFETTFKPEPLKKIPLSHKYLSFVAKIAEFKPEPLLGKSTFYVEYNVQIQQIIGDAKINMVPHVIRKEIIIEGFQKSEDVVQNSIDASKIFITNNINKVIKFTDPTTKFSKGETLPSKVGISNLEVISKEELKKLLPNGQEELLDGVEFEIRELKKQTIKDDEGTIIVHIAIIPDPAHEKFKNATNPKDKDNNVNPWEQTSPFKITEFANTNISDLNDVIITLNNNKDELRRILPSKFIEKANKTLGARETKYHSLVKSILFRKDIIPNTSWTLILMGEPVAKDDEGKLEFKFRINKNSDKSKIFTITAGFFKTTDQSILDNAAPVFTENYKAKYLPTRINVELFKEMIEEFENGDAKLESEIIEDSVKFVFNDNVPKLVVTYKIKANDNKSINKIITLGKKHLKSKTTVKMETDNSSVHTPVFVSLDAIADITQLNTGHFEFKTITEENKKLYVYTLSNFTKGTKDQTFNATVTVTLKPDTPTYKDTDTQKNASFIYEVQDISFAQIEIKSLK